MATDRKPPSTTTSLFYSYGSNSMSAASVFAERNKYERVVFPSLGVADSFNFWDETAGYYGRQNTHGNSILVGEGALRQLRYAEDEETLFALNFVADAWRDFCEEIYALRDRGILSSAGPYADMLAIKAWRSSTAAYHSYMTETVYPAFASSWASFSSINNRIKDFNTFLKVFTEFAQVVIKSGPLTLSGFLESNVTTSPLNTGLAIEISSDPHSDDFNKQQQFFYDANFKIVNLVASQYGFIIDRNAPWRFVIDLHNPAAREYMFGVLQTSAPPVRQPAYDDCGRPILNQTPLAFDFFGYSQIPGFEHVVRHASGYKAYTDAYAASGEQIYPALFDGAYNESWSVDMLYLRPYLLDFYNRFVLADPFYTEKNPLKDACFAATDFLRERTPENAGIFDAEYHYRWSLKTNYLIRSWERVLEKTVRQRKNDIQRILAVFSQSPGTGEQRHAIALRYLQENFIGAYPLSPELSPQTYTKVSLGRGPMYPAPDS